ncbi:MAG TPA: polysaccharide deacetylase family protein [Syntrophomonadaceae bacterium]|nr:polysaccharide deacetylase family protein [Syntrophomonadaceae bacterium]
MNLQDRLNDHKLSIFLFHGVVNNSDYTVRNYTRKHLPSGYFRECISSLSKSGYALSMDDVIKYHQTGEPFPPGAFVVTFDDGFENNYSVAAPILCDYKVPATFYFSTFFIETNAMSWIDHIEYCFENTKQLSLRLPWQVESVDIGTVQNKLMILDYLRAYVKTDASISEELLVKEIYRQCGSEEIKSSDDPLDLKVTWKQVQELSGHKLFTIGGHSHHHVNLAFLSNTELENEIKTSFMLMKDKAGITLRHYSYPEGLEYCYSPQVIAILKKYGIECCPTAIDGTNQSSDDLFHLKRIAVV